MLTFCVTVVLYNPDESVLGQFKIYAKVFAKIIVIDNSETINKKLVNYITRLNSVEYFNMNGNKGVSEALNLAFKKAIILGFDYILTMDQDSCFSETDIRTMMRSIENSPDSSIGIFAPNFCRRYFDIKINSFVNSKPRYSTKKLTKVLCAITSGSFIRIKALKKILPIDNNYFIANVDIDICAALHIIGYSTVIVGEAILKQQTGGLVTKNKFAEILRFTNFNSSRYYYQVRNSFYLKNKFKNSVRFKIFGYLQLVKYIFKIGTSESEKWSKIKMGILGYKDYKKGIMGKKEDI